MSEALAIRAFGLQKTFRIGFFRKRVEALRDSTFDVRVGEVFGLVGPNGAGKTTTMKILLGLIFADAGEATMFGAPVGTAQSRSRLGFLAGPPHFYENLRPGELLEYFGRLQGLDGAVLKKRIPELLDRVGLSGAAEKHIRKFSKGMNQRVGLAQALLGDPDLVILDEPMGGLDPMGRKDVRDIIMDLRDRGKTVLFSSHILSDVEEVCDRIAIMVNGRVTRCGPMHDLIEQSARSIDVLIRPATPTPKVQSVAGFDGQVMPGGDVAFHLPADADINAFLSASIERGATVLSVDRHRTELEDVFVSEAERSSEGE